MSQIYSVGAGGDGGLGNGSTANITTPALAGPDTDWAFVASGDLTGGCTLYIKIDGTLWVSGANSPKLGLGVSPGQKNSPVQIGSASDWATASVGYNHACAVKTNGDLYMWGGQGYGEHGRGNTTEYNVPTKVGTASWARVYCGYQFSVGIRTDGTLWFAGDNSSGQSAQGVTYGTYPTWTQIGAATNWLEVHVGTGWFIALNALGEVWGSGITGYGVLGNGGTGGNSLAQMNAVEAFAHVGGGQTHALVIGVSGKLYACGNGATGALGQGSTTSYSVPTQVGVDTDWLAVASSCGLCSVASRAGGIYCWGDNWLRQTGATSATYPLLSPTTSNYVSTSVIGNRQYARNYSALLDDTPSGPPPAYAEAPMTMTVANAHGAATAPMTLRVYANGVAEAPIAMVVLDSLEVSRWTAMVTLDGVDVSAQLTGTLSVDAEEGAARVADFTLLPPPSVVNPTAWTGAAVIIDVVRLFGAVELPVRVFTGVVDVAAFDQVAMSVRFACTDDLQNRVAALTKAQIDTLVGGRYHVGVQGEIDEHWAYAQARMESVAGSLDAGPHGGLRVTPWTGLPTWLSFDAGDTLGDTQPPALTPPKRATLLNRVDISIQYRYYRCRERRAWLAWSKSVIGPDATASGYQYPTQEMISSALDGAGWHRIHTSYSPAPAQVPIATPAGYYIETGGVAGMTAQVSQRHAQTVTETHAVTVSAPTSIAANGELSKPLRAALASDWTPDEWEQDYTVSTPDASVSDVDYAGTATRAEFEACYLTAVDVASVMILASHRQAVQRFPIPCLPEADVIYAAELSIGSVHAVGKIGRVEHVLDIDAGTADTFISLPLSGVAAGGILSPTVITPPAPADVDGATGTDAWNLAIPALGVHVGGVSGHAYSADLMGYLCNAPANYTVTNGVDTQGVANAFYDGDWEYPTTGFRVQMPGVANTHRNPLELFLAADFEIEVPEDTLTLTIT